MSTPDLAEPIIAYRSWDVRAGVLEAVSGGEPWLPGVPAEASCRYAPGATRRSNPFLVWGAVPSEPSYYHINLYLPLAKETRITAAGKTYTVTGVMRGVNEQGWTVSTEMIPGANVMVKKEPRPPHDHCPDMHCTCGLHAHKYEGEVDVLGGRAWGKVALWGRVIEHETGYRAQYAYPVELHCPSDKIANQLSKAYGVPATGPIGDMGDDYPQSYGELLEDAPASRLDDSIWAPLGCIAAGGAIGGVIIIAANLLHL